MKRIILKNEFHDLNKEDKLRRYRELWHAAGRFEILPDYPLHLDLELSGICNLSCEHCFQEELDKKSLGLMDTMLFKRLIDDGIPRGLCAVKLQIRGESFLHPDIIDLIEYAKKSGVLDIQVTTNGTLLDETMIEKILDSGLDGIIFSVDARHETACKEKKIAPDYEKVRRNIQAFLDCRKAKGLKHPWVRLKASVEESSQEVLENLRQTMQSDFPLADIYIVGRVFDIKKDCDSYPDLHTNYRLDPCAILMQRLAVFWNGQVTTCCMDYHGDFQLGAVPECSIEEIWNSKNLQGLRKAHIAGRRTGIPICKHCHLNVSSVNPDVFIDPSPRNKLDYEYSTSFI